MLHPKKILFPVDVDPANKGLITKVLSIALEVDAELIFLYVNDPAAGYRTPKISDEDVKEIIEKEVGGSDLMERVTHSYMAGKAPLGKTVAEIYEQEGAELIVIGHQIRTSFFSALFETPDEIIVDWAPGPVLVLPEE